MAGSPETNEHFNEIEKEKLVCFFRELYDHVKEKDVIDDLADITHETEQLIDAIFKEINDSDDNPFTIRKRLTTGSTYDGTTTGQISDFDFMGLLDIPPSSLGFIKGLSSKSCQIVVKDVNLRNYFQEASKKYNLSVITEEFFFLNDARFLFHRIVGDALEKLKNDGHHLLEEPGKASIFLHEQSSAPCATMTVTRNIGRDTDVTFGLETDYKAIDGVPKVDPDYGKCIIVPKGPEGQPQEWAMSFSQQEKQRLSKMKESHKKILTILKAIISIFKSSTGFDYSICSSYVVKTIVYHHDSTCNSQAKAGEIDADCIVDIVGEIERLYLLDILQKDGGLKFLVQICAGSYFSKIENYEKPDLWFLLQDFYRDCATKLYDGNDHLPDFHPTFLDEPNWFSIPATRQITAINIDSVREEVAKVTQAVESDASKLDHLKGLWRVVQDRLPYQPDTRYYLYRMFSLFNCGIKNLTSVYGPPINVAAAMPFNPSKDVLGRDKWCIGVVYAHLVAISLRKLIIYICRASDREIKRTETQYRYDRDVSAEDGNIWFKIIPTLRAKRPPEILDVFHFVISRSWSYQE
ncbi:unnamed protein product [Owenia fusiformis]|uniref:Uncharacterized protein n=1 Tax=Owenia fusiformis TaxID=6347 RepID=A0A8S4P6U2_OWEFU|nr:unnamed protein product [Owenia fusiformis]